MPTSTVAAATAMTKGVVARNSCTSDKRRLSQATTKGPAVPKIISTKPMDAPAGQAQTGTAVVAWDALGRKALIPTPATYTPNKSKGQRLFMCCTSHKPTSVPSTMPGKRRRSSRHCTCRQFSPL
jgi:hypothetical protein